MGTSPVSYRDPAYSSIEADVEQTLGLPEGLLSSIRLKGERSNADQVSSAGARTVYQITGPTRATFMKRNGVDAFSGDPKDAAMVAGLTLKDNLTRNKGNVRQAVREYVGGTDPANWGRTVDAYVKRVTGGGDPASARGGPSTYDRVAARAGPSMEKVYQAYRSGKMTAQDRSAFENAVLNGQIVLKPGWKIDRKPTAPVLPASLVDAYNSHRMDDDPEGRKMIEDAVASGQARLPDGTRLARPAPRTIGDQLKMGVRSAMTGLAGIGDALVTKPLNTVVNAVTGANIPTEPLTDVATSAADAMGLPAPESDSEKLVSAINQGAVQGLATAGAGLAAAGAEGVAGAAGRALASSPLLDTVSGAASGGAQESARQAGAGPVGQIAAGLAGGALPVGLAGTAERALSRTPKTLADTVAETPKAAVVDEAGNLTPHGQEIATQHGASPEDIRQAYEAPPSVKAGTANEQMPETQAREATTGAPVEAAPEPPLVEQAAAEKQPEIPDVPSPNGPDNNAPDAMPGTALDRVSTAKEFGVDMSRGQATKSFDVQDREQQLKNSNGPAAEQMRQFVARQTEQVKQAVEDFRKGFGDTAATPEERGKTVQDAVRELRELGQKGVTALYKAARELGQEVPLDTSGIRSAYDRLMVEADVPDQVKKVLTQEAARYGLVGKPVVIDKAGGAVTAENGITKVKLDNGDTVAFHGPPETLRLDNAEDLRKKISAQYPVDGPTKLTGLMKRAIDDATEQAAETVASGKTAVPDAMKAAREAHIEQVKTFRAADVVQKIADWKKGQADVTGTLSPEQVVKAALASTSDLKRVKAVLLSKPTTSSKAAWRALQAHGLAELFGKATTRSTNAGGEIAEAISGAKLRSAIAGFPPDKLKVLLDPEQFNTLMKLRRVIEDVTIPITGTVNHSNSGNLIMRLVSDVENRVTGAFAAAGVAIGGPVGGAVGGAVGRTVAPAVKAVKQAKVDAETLAGATDYTSGKAAAEGTEQPKASVAAKAKAAASGTLRAFIETYSSPRVLAPVLASTEGATQ